VSRLHVRARALIVGGWGFVVFGSFGILVMYAHLGYFTSGQSLAGEGTLILPIIANTSAVVAWWWLTRITISDDQLIFVRRSFYALGIQSLFIAGIVMCDVSLAQTRGTSNQLIIAAQVCQAVGGLAVFVGFVVLAGIYAPQRELPREAPRPADLTALDDDDD
jgi:hypothetical protein